MKVMGINHVTVLTANKEKSKDFYEKVLGLELFPVGKSLWMKVGNQFLHITEDSANPVKTTFYHYAIEVDGFGDYIKGLINKGIEVFDLDKELKKVKVNAELDDKFRQFFVHDPDGNLIEIIDTENSFFRKGLE